MKTLETVRNELAKQFKGKNSIHIIGVKNRMIVVGTDTIPIPNDVISKMCKIAAPFAVSFEKVERVNALIWLYSGTPTEKPRVKLF